MESRVIENKLVESNIYYMAIPIDEYKELLAIKERSLVLKSYVEDTQYPDDGTILKILGHKGRGIE